MTKLDGAANLPCGDHEIMLDERVDHLKEWRNVLSRQHKWTTRQKKKKREIQTVCWSSHIFRRSTHEIVAQPRLPEW